MFQLFEVKIEDFEKTDFAETNDLNLRETEKLFIKRVLSAPDYGLSIEEVLEIAFAGLSSFPEFGEFDGVSVRTFDYCEDGEKAMVVLMKKNKVFRQFFVTRKVREVLKKMTVRQALILVAKKKQVGDGNVCVNR